MPPILSHGVLFGTVGDGRGHLCRRVYVQSYKSRRINWTTGQYEMQTIRYLTQAENEHSLTPWERCQRCDIDTTYIAHVSINDVPGSELDLDAFVHSAPRPFWIAKMSTRHRRHIGQNIQAKRKARIRATVDEDLDEPNTLRRA